MNDEAPGWDAIEAACKRIYGNRKPLHVGTAVSYIFGGRDPLHGISAYKSQTQRWHWHFVTFGYSELWEKESRDPAVSGYGFEMTFRLACKPTDKKPPNWVFGFLQNLARYVFSTGNVFADGHYLDCNGPIAQAKKTALRAIVFTADPELKSITTAHGLLQFLQVVGITIDEFETIQEWNAQRFLEVLARDNALLITDLPRRSILSDTATGQLVQKRLRAEGSNSAGVSHSSFTWKRTARQSGETLVVTIGAKIVPAVTRLLRGRILHGNDLILHGPKAAIQVQAAKRAGWKEQRGRLVLKLTRELAEAMAASLPPQRGTYRWEQLPGLTVKVIPTEIQDQDGKVVDVIG